jgi:hypothetical protein
MDWRIYKVSDKDYVVAETPEEAAFHFGIVKDDGWSPAYLSPTEIPLDTEFGGLDNGETFNFMPIMDKRMTFREAIDVFLRAGLNMPCHIGFIE